MKPDMTWNGRQKRWFKKHSRKQHSVACATLEKRYPDLYQSATKEGSLRAANRWWADRQATIGQSPAQQALAAGIDLRRKLIRHCQLEGDTEEAARWQAEIAAMESGKVREVRYQSVTAWHQAITDPSVPSPLERSAYFVGDVPCDPHVSPEEPALQQTAVAILILKDRRKLLDRIAEADKHARWDTRNGKKAGLTDLIRDFLSGKEKDISPARLEELRANLVCFRDWKLDDRADTINSDTLRTWREHIVSTIGHTYLGAKRMSVVRQFVRWLAEDTEILDRPPKNLYSNRLGISVATSPNAIWTDEQVTFLLDHTKGKQRLYYLLMLNCGAYQGDLGQLRRSEVDLDKGTITRIRSKLRHRATDGRTPPVTAYPLWQTTLRLLRQYGNPDTEFVLTTDEGKPIYHVEQKNTGKTRLRKWDAIGDQFRRWKRRYRPTLPQLKDLRHTARSKLDAHPVFGRYALYYLAHAPHSVDAKHYLVPDATQFAEAIKWLGQQWGIV